MKKKIRKYRAIIWGDNAILWGDTKIEMVIYRFMYNLWHNIKRDGKTIIQIRKCV